MSRRSMTSENGSGERSMCVRMRLGFELALKASTMCLSAKGTLRIAVDSFLTRGGTTQLREWQVKVNPRWTSKRRRKRQLTSPSVCFVMLFPLLPSCRTRVEGFARAGAFPRPFQQRSPSDDPTGLSSEVRCTPRPIGSNTSRVVRNKTPWLPCIRCVAFGCTRCFFRTQWAVWSQNIAPVLGGLSFRTCSRIGIS